MPVAQCGRAEPDRRGHADARRERREQRYHSHQHRVRSLRGVETILEVGEARVEVRGGPVHHELVAALGHVVEESDQLAARLVGLVLATPPETLGDQR